jgi:signal transduction histidine kinase
MPSEKGVLYFVILSVFLTLCLGALIYEVTGLVGEIEGMFVFETGDRHSDEHAELENRLEERRLMDVVIQKRMTSFLSTMLLLLVAVVILTLLFSLRHFIYSPGGDQRKRRTEVEENLYLLDELMDEEEESGGAWAEDSEAVMLENYPAYLESDDNEPLESSYNKMVEALQKVNELEKRHTIELADANAKLEKEIAERERAEKEIRTLSRKLIDGIESAQKSLAQDLHDEFGQTLAALHMNVETLWNAIPEEMAGQKKNINDIILLIEQLGDKIRSISSDLRPDLLDDLGLVPTLEWYIKEFEEQHPDIHIDFHAVGLKKRLNSDIELVLYRIFQESLNNVLKHANAKTVSIMLTYNYPKTILIIKDDGDGFDPLARSTGIGLIGMRERAVSMGGSVEIRSVKGKGTSIRTEVPVAGMEGK